MQELPRTATYYLMFIGAGMISGILGPSLIYLAEASGSTMTQISWLFMTRAMGGICGSILTGRLYDQYSSHRILIMMVVIAVVAMFLVPLSTKLMFLLGLVFLMGFAEVSVNAGGNTLLVWLHLDRVGPYVNGLHFCYGFGSMIVPLIIIAAVKIQGSFHMSYWVVAAYLAFLPIALFKLPSPDSPHAGSKESEATYDRPVFFGLLILFGLCVGIEITFTGWVAAYGVMQGIDKIDSTSLPSLYWVMLSFGRLATIPLMKRFSTASILYVCLIICFVATLGMFAGVGMLKGVTLLFGLAFAAVFPTLFTFGSRLVPLTGGRTGQIFLACSVGGMLIPTLTGPLIEHVGSKALPVVLLTMLLAMMAGLFALVARQRHRTISRGFSADR